MAKIHNQINRRIVNNERHYTTLFTAETSVSTPTEGPASEDTLISKRQATVTEEPAFFDSDFKELKFNSGKLFEDDDDSYDEPVADSPFTRNIKAGYGAARPWRGLLELLIVAAPMFLAVGILVKCLRVLGRK